MKTFTQTLPVRPYSLYRIVIVSFVFLVANQLAAQPVISSFSPVSGPVGTTVTITGTNFSSNANDNVVYFGAVKSTVSAASTTALTVSVPIGATYQPISVTVNGRTAFSNVPYVVTFAGGGAITSNSFEDKLDFSTEESPYDIEAADLDGDGRADIIVSNGAYPYSISTFRNTGSNGAISFASKIDVPAAIGPFGLATGDIDGDGKLDVLVANMDDLSVSVFMNTSTVGSISFAPRMDLSVIGAPVIITLNDVDKDGKLDLAIVNFFSDRVTIYKNTSTPGSISFGTNVSYPAGTTPSAIAFADFDGDGWQDFAITNIDPNNVLLFRNNASVGSIAFTQIGSVSAGGHGQRIATADFDSDNKPDLAVTTSENQVVLFRNTTSAGTISFAGKKEYATPINPGGISIADLDGDAKPDVAFTTGVDSVLVMRNSSTAGTLAFDELASMPVGSSPFDVAISDLDGDGRLDLAVVNQGDNGGNSISVLRNKVIAPNIISFTPTSAPAGSTVIIHGTNFNGITAVSFGGTPAQSFSVNSANEIAAVVGAGSSGEVSVTGSLGTAKRKGFTVLPQPKIDSFNPTTGTVGTVVTITGSGFVGVTGVSFGGTAARSFTVVSPTTIQAEVGLGSSGSVSVTTSVATVSLAGFTFSPLSPPIVISGFSPSSGPVGTVVTIEGQNFSNSLTGNVVYFGATKAEVTAASQTSLTVKVPVGANYNPITVIANNLVAYSPRPFVVTFAGGDPAFTAGSFTSPILFEMTSGTPTELSGADLDGDGKADFIHANRYEQNISVFRNTSTATTPSIAPVLKFNVGVQPQSVSIGDLDGDGKLDVVTANADATVSILRNISSPGNIAFAPKMDLPSVQAATSIAISDINLDGRLDLLVGHSSYDYLTVYANTSNAGDLSFAGGVDFATGDGPRNIIAGDLDADGKPDIVTANSNSGDISIFRNVTPLAGSVIFDNRIDVPAGGTSYRVKMGDLDGDGKKDLVLVYADGNKVSIFRNTTGSGAISFAPKIDLATEEYQIDVVISDFNGDRRPDLAVLNTNPHSISLFRNKSTAGTMLFSQKVDFSMGALAAESLCDIDINGDGKVDIVTGNSAYVAGYSVFLNSTGKPTTLPSGTNPVSGEIVTAVHVDSSVQTFNGRPYVQRHYDISPVNNPVTSTATVTLYFTQQDFDNYNAFTGHGLDLPTGPSDNSGKANLRVFQYHGFSATGEPASYTGNGIEINPDDSNIVWNALAECWEVSFNVNGFSGFFVSTLSPVLPVKLAEFNVHLQAADGVLNWKTFDEEALGYFDVERSLDGRAFTTIDRVTSAGNAGEHKYDLQDQNIASYGVPVIYYRLRMVNKDGTFEYSKVISVNISGLQTTVALYPNPVKETAVISIVAARNESLRCFVVDATGRIAMQKNVNVTGGMNSVPIDVKNIISGSYTLLVKGSTIKTEIRFLKQ